MSYRKDNEKKRISSLRLTIGTIDKLREFALTTQETNEEILLRMISFIALRTQRFKEHSIGMHQQGDKQ